MSIGSEYSIKPVREKSKFALRLFYSPERSFTLASVSDHAKLKLVFDVIVVFDIIEQRRDERRAV
jgi:hypothetical protein